MSKQKIELTYVYLESDRITSRGMAWVDETLPEKYQLDTKFLEKHLYSECLKK